MKTSDLLYAIFIVITFILLYVVNILAIGKKQIQDNWPIYRCNPMVMPFASIHGSTVLAGWRASMWTQEWSGKPISNPKRDNCGSTKATTTLRISRAPHLLSPGSLSTASPPPLIRACRPPLLSRWCLATIPTRISLKPIQRQHIVLSNVEGWYWCPTRDVSFWGNPPVPS